MNLNHLQYFRVLAKLEHYTQAAEQLSITQPSLSHAISTLEKELGTYLFEKQGRNVRLTKYGRFFLTYVENALDELELGEKKLRELTSQSNGSIDLGFIYTLGAQFVPTLVNDFLKYETYQNIRFSFGQGNTKQIIQDLKNEKYDLALCSYVENEPEIEFIPITQQELVMIVPPHHPLAKKESVDLKEVSEYPFISFNKESGIRKLIDALFDEINVQPTIICEVEEDTAVAGLVSVNYGVAIVPRISFLDQFNVKILPITNPKHERYIYLASVKNKYVSPSVTAFKNFILSHSKTLTENNKK